MNASRCLFKWKKALVATVVMFDEIVVDDDDDDGDSMA